MLNEIDYRTYYYPENTPGSSNIGKYFHQLSEASQTALTAVERWVYQDNINLNNLGTNDLHHQLLILRYLRANQFNVSKTISHIEKNIEWRKSIDIDTLIKQKPEKILGCTLEDLTSVFPHWHSGYDKTGRPVLFKQYGKFEAGQIKKLVGGKNFDAVVQYHIWEQEACGRLCLAQAKKNGTIVETITAVIDIKDMGMSQITSDFLKLTKLIAEIDQHQYPETLGRAFIINAPSAFPLVWRMVKPWLDPATVAKITVLSGPKEFIPVLQDYIGEENLPSNYGGTLPPLSPQVHPYAETMLSYPTEEQPAENTAAVKTEEEAFDPLVLEYPYPESTPGAAPGNGKYWRQLSETSKEALLKVEQWVVQDKVDLKQLGTTDLHPALLLLRYLRANQFNASKTIAHIQKNLEWRRTRDISSLVTQSPESILGCTMTELTSVFPHWHSGYDKTGRPVLFKQYGKFEAAQIKRLTGGNFDNVTRYHLWEQEACGRLCLEQSKKTHTVVETITAVIDIKDMGISQVTSDFLKLTKLIAEIDQHQYPETLGRAFIINAPSAFPLVWRMVKPWLDPATVAKITVLSGPKEFIPVLQDYIGEENLPSNYGGTLPPLSPQVHPYAETMLSLPVAAAPVDIPAEVEPQFDPVVLTYPYPPTTPGALPNNGKYWQNLSQIGQDALKSVEQWVVQDKVDLKQLGTTDLHPALLLLRYLRANQFNATKTIAHIQKNLEWRRTRDISSLVTQSPESILGCTMAELTSVFPHWHSGYDKTGRPVLFKQYGKFEAGLIKKLVGGSFDNVVRYHLWEQEACGRLCLAQSQKRKMVIETITAVIDIKDMGMSQITRDFLSLTKLLAEIDQHQYPETLGRAFIINAPSAFPLVWRMVKPWLDPATVAKITVLSGPKDFIPVLQDYIGEENLPSNYGGTLPPLSPQVHPYAETMMSVGTMESRTDEDARAAYMRVNDRNSFRNSFKRRGSFRANNHTEDPAEQTSSLWFYPSLMWTGLQKNWFMDSSPQDDNESEWDGGSEGSGSSSEELHFEDAFETQSDLETNSHSHLYSNQPHEGTSSGPVKKRRKRSLLKRIFFMRTLMKCYRYIVCEKSLRSLTIQRLEMRFLISSACHLLCAIGCAAISGTALAEISWSSSGARLQLWAFTVVMLLSCFMIFFDFVGYYGIQSKNWPLMVMYSAGTTVGTLVFAAVTIACFFYYALPRSTGVGGASLNSTLSKNRTFMFVLAVGSLFVTICATIPLVHARGVIVKLREAQGKHLQTRQIQVVLKVAQSISTIAALVMICYGSVGLEYLLSIYYSKALFPIYGLIYGGVAVLITSTIGVWVAMTVHRSVLRVYQYIILPFIVALLLIIALLCFDGLYNTEQGVENSYDNLNTSESEEKVKSTVQTLMLVTGTLTIFLCVFQTISLIATRALSSTIDSSSQVKEKLAILQAIKEKELGIYNSGGLVDGREVPNHDSHWSGFSVEHLGRLYMLYSRNQRDKFVITWAVLMGIFNIFVSGTLAVLSRSASSQEEQNSWMFSLNLLLGRADTRFVISNAYLRSSETLLSVVIGPLMLLYAWSTFVYAPYRHVLGMMVSLSQMLIWTMYLLMELYAGMKHFQGRQAPTLLAFVIVIGFVCYFLLPGWIFVKEMISSVNDTSTSDSQELLMEANDETAPFLNKIEFDLESGTFFDGSNHAGGAAGTGRKPPRTSESSLEQMLNLGTRARHPSLGGSTTSPETLFADDASTSTTRSFIMSLGTENAESNAELERYRARSASAFRFHDPHLSTTPAHTPLYADKVTPTSATRLALTTEDSENYKEDEIVEEEKKSDEVLSPTKIGGVPFPISPPSRILSPTRLRPTGIELPPTIPEESQLSLYSPVGAVNISTPPSLYPRLSAQDSMTSFLRKRAVAPLKPRVSAESTSSRNMTITGGITQVANATAALDPNRVLPMLMKMGVSSVEAAGMMTYLMHMKQLGDGKKKKKNSLAMVV